MTSDTLWTQRNCCSVQNSHRARMKVFLCICLFMFLQLGAAQSVESSTKRIVRRKKMLPGFGVEERTDNHIGSDDLSSMAAEHRSISPPVRVLKKRLIKPVPPIVLPQPVFDNTTQDLDLTVQDSVAPKPDAVKRFLSLFTIVSFKNDACVSTGGTNGTCYSSNECTSKGGASAGTCASGFGVCCLFTATCGGSTNVNGTYFQNSGYPSTFNSVGSCQLTINKCASDVCQLRLDILSMTLSGPETTDNQCQGDQFIVSGGSPLPAICGVNTGQHMYVDMGLSSNSPIVLTVVTSGASFQRSFSVKVTQIECSSLSKASDGCVQYFTGVNGQFSSFNFNAGSGLQLSNTDYTVCIRMERNFCGIQYSACIVSTATGTAITTTTPRAFSITGGTPTVGSVVGNSCLTDWITIPCATNTNDPTTQSGSPVVCVDRICGMVFNSVTTPNTSPNVPVYSFSKPFNVFVHTDSLEGSSAPAESLNRGFCLNYVQQPCTSSTG
ncbi:uncharacterized protein LOC111711301 [Eurytemora carolleeae]|uniref:uncharacterized protein LOC111711301 n=1 Tax=Eurytemora carolleeae TaxID=1294199 RepID=UPI000C78EEC0|nr:uncharacterized protein LOC111711301 [Eurytemora carolleeae]|eukprot:XP_023341394.1 uncharacterized protein LOC111711301 [Eurytemora affinis]